MMTLRPPTVDSGEGPVPRASKTEIRLRKLTAWLAAEHGIRADVEHVQDASGRWQWWLRWYDGPAELPPIGAKAEELGVDTRNLMSARIVTDKTPAAQVLDGPGGSETAGSQRPPEVDDTQARGTSPDQLAGTMEALAGLIGTARDGGLDTAAALSSLTAVRRLAAELEHGELAFIGTAARPGRRSPLRWAHAAGRPHRSVILTSPAACYVHR